MKKIKEVDNYFLVYQEVYMNIEEKDIIILSDDNHYIVVKKVNIDNINYYYVSDINDKGNIKFLYEDGNELV